MSKKAKCSSCRNGFDGRNGNGYQPCSCDRKETGKPHVNVGTIGHVDHGRAGLAALVYAVLVGRSQ